jgi:hypothetical protein
MLTSREENRAAERAGVGLLWCEALAMHRPRLAADREIRPRLRAQPPIAGTVGEKRGPQHE